MDRYTPLILLRMTRWVMGIRVDRIVGLAEMVEAEAAEIKGFTEWLSFCPLTIFWQDETWSVCDVDRLEQQIENHQADEFRSRSSQQLERLYAPASPTV